MKVLRHLPVFGYDDAPHGHAEVDLEDVRVPASNLLLGEGRGFEIAQGRLGPGTHPSLHALDRCRRARARAHVQASQLRVAFGKPISSQSVWHERIAESRCMIDQARLMVLNAAYMMDTVGNKVARKEIAMIKVIVPNMTLQVIDWAIQAHGAGGVTARLPARAAVGGPAHAAHRRRPGRSASQRDREARAREVSACARTWLRPD